MATKTKPGDALLPREFEVALWVSRRNRNVDIANRLGISRGAVNVYVSRTYRKVGAQDREDLRSWFIAHFPTATAIRAGYAEACMRCAAALKRKRNQSGAPAFRAKVKFTPKPVRLERNLSPDLRLTETERRIFDLLVLEGLTDRQIGQRIGLSGATVKCHLMAIRDKKGVDTRAELIVQFYKEHIPEKATLNREVALADCKVTLAECLTTLRRCAQTLDALPVAQR